MCRGSSIHLPLLIRTWTGVHFKNKLGEKSLGSGILESLKLLPFPVAALIVKPRKGGNGYSKVGLFHEEAAFRHHVDSMGRQRGRSLSLWMNHRLGFRRSHRLNLSQNSVSGFGVPIYLRWGHKQVSNLAEAFVHHEGWRVLVLLF